jgi:hypothetical protein
LAGWKPWAIITKGLDAEQWERFGELPRRLMAGIRMPINWFKPKRR